MTEPARDDWRARAELERETHESRELAGPMSLAEAFYLARRAEGLGDMEARLATRLRDRWPPRAPRPRLITAQVLGLVSHSTSF